jgi:hypothetical protein
MPVSITATVTPSPVIEGCLAAASSWFTSCA